MPSNSYRYFHALKPNEISFFNFIRKEGGKSFDQQKISDMTLLQDDHCRGEVSTEWSNRYIALDCTGRNRENTALFLLYGLSDFAL